MIRVLVTGFGAFPGVRRNPTLPLLQALACRRARFARLGIALDLYVLPVAYARLAPALARLIEDGKPDVILHFGLAGGRKRITAERFARNRANILRPDADGRVPKALVLDKQGSDRRKARVPLAQINATWHRAGIAGGLSRDAGAYLCNAGFYRSLGSDAAAVGFIHIPYPRAALRLDPPPQVRRNPELPTFAQIATAAEIAVIVAAQSARQIQGALRTAPIQAPLLRRAS